MVNVDTFHFILCLGHTRNLTDRLSPNDLLHKFAQTFGYLIKSANTLLPKLSTMNCHSVDFFAYHQEIHKRNDLREEHILIEFFETILRKILEVLIQCTDFFLQSGGQHMREDFQVDITFNI